MVTVFDVLLLRQVTIVLSDRCWDNWLHSGSVIICKCDMGHYYQHSHNLSHNKIPDLLSALSNSITKIFYSFLAWIFSLRSGAAVSRAPLIAARQRLLIVIPCSAQHPWLLILYCSQMSNAFISFTTIYKYTVFYTFRTPTTKRLSCRFKVISGDAKGISNAEQLG